MKSVVLFLVVLFSVVGGTVIVDNSSEVVAWVAGKGIKLALPMQINGTMKLIDVDSEGDTLQYSIVLLKEESEKYPESKIIYRISKIIASRGNGFILIAPKLTDVILDDICKPNSPNSFLLNRGVVLQNKFYVEGGDYIGGVKIDDSDCVS